MNFTPIYLDNHATTRVDPRVVQAMMPTMDVDFGNPASATHALGQRAAALVEAAREAVATALGATSAKEIVFTSGASESNNLALRGIAERRGAGHLISVVSEHPSVLAPLEKLARRGFSVTLLPVISAGHPMAGRVDLERLRDAFRADTFLVSVMLANNEIGVIQPLPEIAAECRQRGVHLHCDATQAVGKVPVDVMDLGVDLLSFTAHKIYGPKGTGGLFVRRSGSHLPRPLSQIDGGQQEGGQRGGTLNVTGIVGLAHALTLCRAEWKSEAKRAARLRATLFRLLREGLGELPLNGPAFDDCPQVDDIDDLATRYEWRRLPGNLNCQFPGIDGHTLMVRTPQVCLSSGSACTATSSEPSHVLKALGLNDDQVRCSLRFGIGRFNTEAEMLTAAEQLVNAARRLRSCFS